jgi:Protein tyrosine and serine/threonine kinase
LITEEYSAKLGDYGGSENLHPTDFYKISENNSIPLRWLAPECVQKTVCI